MTTYIKGPVGPTTSYLLRDIDPELWRRVKSRAALDGLSLKDIITKMLRAYATLGRQGW